MPNVPTTNSSCTYYCHCCCFKKAVFITTPDASAATMARRFFPLFFPSLFFSLSVSIVIILTRLVVLSVLCIAQSVDVPVRPSFFCCHVLSKLIWRETGPVSRSADVFLIELAPVLCCSLDVSEDLHTGKRCRSIFLLSSCYVVVCHKQKKKKR